MFYTKNTFSALADFVYKGCKFWLLSRSKGFRLLLFRAFGTMNMLYGKSRNVVNHKWNAHLCDEDTAVTELSRAILFKFNIDS